MKQQSSQLADLDPARMLELLHSDSRKHFIAALRLAMRQVLASMHAEEHYDRVITEIKREPCYRDLNNNWEKLDPAARGRKWYELMARLVQVAYAGRPYCMRCGDCCRQGSPSLHLEDGELLSRGLISTRQVYPLRRGEPVSHSIAGRVDMLSEELIKIREDPETRYCIFYFAPNHSCHIYDHRPLQCRFQECWNPAALERLWKQEKLTRRHLLDHDHDLWELLQTHDERCAPEKLDAAFNQIRKTRDLAILDQILDILRKDMVFRTFFTTKLARDQEELDFLLGRPMGEVVRVYGMTVEKDDEGVYRLVADG
jgi:Fe-S-cluster containining protein